jgi:hypothetical protein
MAEPTPSNPSEGLRPADILTANYWDGAALFTGEAEPWAVAGTHPLARLTGKLRLNSYLRAGGPPVALDTFVDGEWDAQGFASGTIVALHTESLCAMSRHDGEELQAQIADVEPPKRPLVGRPMASYEMRQINTVYANQVALGAVVIGTSGRVLYEVSEAEATSGKRPRVKLGMLNPAPGRFTIGKAVLYEPRGTDAQLILRRNRVDILKYGTGSREPK